MRPGHPSALIVDVVRTPLGARNGRLAHWHPADLAGACLRALGRRNDLDPALVDDVVLGCVMPIGAQSANVARNAVLAAGWPDTVPAMTVDRQGASAHAALHVAAHAVLAGAAEVVVAGGVEVMSLVPLGATMGQGYGAPFGPAVSSRYRARGGLIPEGVAAEALLARRGLCREQLDEYTVTSRERALAASARAPTDPAVLSLTSDDPASNDPATQNPRPARPNRTRRASLPEPADECVRPTTLAELAALRPTFVPEGSITAGNTAPIADGAGAVLVMGEAAAARLGARPLARIDALATAAMDPLDGLTAAAPAALAALRRAGRLRSALDLSQLHEGFAVSLLACRTDLDLPFDTVNVDGGELARGNPLGASAVVALSTLLHALHARGGRFGLLAGSAAGGIGLATVLERLD